MLPHNSVVATDYCDVLLTYLRHFTHVYLREARRLRNRLRSIGVSVCFSRFL